MYKSMFSECQVSFSCTSNLCINNKYAQSQKTLSQKAVGANPANPSVSPFHSCQGKSTERQVHTATCTRTWQGVNLEARTYFISGVLGHSNIWGLDAELGVVGDSGSGSGSTIPLLPSSTISTFPSISALASSSPLLMLSLLLLHLRSTLRPPPHLMC